MATPHFLKNHSILSSCSFVHIASAMIFLKNTKNLHVNRYARFCQHLADAKNTEISFEDALRLFCAEPPARQIANTDNDRSITLASLFAENHVTLYRYFAHESLKAYILPEATNDYQPAIHNETFSFLRRLAQERVQAIALLDANPSILTALINLSEEEIFFYALNEDTPVAVLVYNWLCRNGLFNVPVFLDLAVPALKQINNTALLKTLATIVYQDVVSKLHDQCHVPFPMFLPHLIRNGRTTMQLNGDRLTVGFLKDGTVMPHSLNIENALLIRSIDDSKAHVVTNVENNQIPASGVHIVHSFSGINEYVYTNPSQATNAALDALFPVKFKQDVLNFSELFSTNQNMLPTRFSRPNLRDFSNQASLETGGLGQLLSAYNIAEFTHDVTAQSIVARNGTAAPMVSNLENHYTFYLLGAYPPAVENPQVLVNKFYFGTGADAVTSPRLPHIFNSLFVDFFAFEKPNGFNILRIDSCADRIIDEVVDDVSTLMEVQIGASWIYMNALTRVPDSDIRVELMSTCNQTETTTSLLLGMEFGCAAFFKNFGPGQKYMFVMLVVSSPKATWLEQGNMSSPQVKQIANINGSLAYNLYNTNDKLSFDLYHKIRREQAESTRTSFTMSDYQVFFDIFDKNSAPEFSLEMVQPEPRFKLKFNLPVLK